MEEILRDNDDEGHGKLDLSEFRTSIAAIDPQCTPSDLQHIFELLADGNGEISIARFVTHIRSRHEERGSGRRNRISNESSLQTAKDVFRGAFSDVFGDNEIWGDSKVYTVPLTLSIEFVHKI